MTESTPTTTRVEIQPQHPFPRFSLNLPSNAPRSCLATILSPIVPTTNPFSLRHSISGRTYYRSAPSVSVSIDGTSADDNDDNETFATDDSIIGHFPLSLTLTIPLLGGKGGFASQLRAQGGRMSSKTATSQDSCRDLSGRRISTMKEATKLADYMKGAEGREKELKREKEERKERLEQEIKRLGGGSEEEKSLKRERLDGDWVEGSRKTVEGVRDAVKEAMMKKRKKNKGASASASASTPAAAATAAASTSTASSSAASTSTVAPSAVAA